MRGLIMVLEKAWGVNLSQAAKRPFEIGENVGPREERIAIGVAISHVGELLISGTGDFIAILSRKLDA